jgi:hypothetical protein
VPENIWDNTIQIAKSKRRKRKKMALPLAKPAWSVAKPA